MNTIIDLFRSFWNLLACIGELLGYVLRFVSAFFQTRASLAARLVAAESQLGICRRRIEQKGSPRFRFTAGFRLLWVVLSKFWAPWQAAAQLMQPATVTAWHIHLKALKYGRNLSSNDSLTLPGQSPNAKPISPNLGLSPRSLSRSIPEPAAVSGLDTGLTAAHILQKHRSRAHHPTD